MKTVEHKIWVHKSAAENPDAFLMAKEEPSGDLYCRATVRIEIPEKVIKITEDQLTKACDGAIVAVLEAIEKLFKNECKANEKLNEHCYGKVIKTTKSELITTMSRAVKDGSSTATMVEILKVIDEFFEDKK